MTNHTIVIPEDIDVNTIPRRSYDFDKGDRRFHTLERALEHAEAEAGRTSVRQVVRTESAPHFVGTFYLVQAIGS